MKIASKSNPLKEGGVESGGGIAGYHRSIRRKWGILLGLAVIVVLFMLISVNAGSSDLSLWEVCRTLLGMGEERSFVVIWQLRMPRVVGAVIAGPGWPSRGASCRLPEKPSGVPSTLGVVGGGHLWRELFHHCAGSRGTDEQPPPTQCRSAILIW